MLTSKDIIDIINTLKTNLIFINTAEKNIKDNGYTSNFVQYTTLLNNINICHKYIIECLKGSYTQTTMIIDINKYIASMNIKNITDIIK